MPLSPCIDLSPSQQRQLLRIARDSVEQGLDAATPLAVDADGLEPALCEPAAVFVTLTQQDNLRGCIGSLQPRDALAQAVANAAFNAAFSDPRFARVTAAELKQIEIEI